VTGVALPVDGGRIASTSLARRLATHVPFFSPDFKHLLGALSGPRTSGAGGLVSGIRHLVPEGRPGGSPSGVSAPAASV